MSVISQTFGLLGQVGVTPRRVQMVVTDSMSSVITPGYLNFAGVNTNQVQKTDIFDIIYSFDVETGSGIYGEFIPSFSPSLIITLVQIGGNTSGTVDDGIANELAYYEFTGNTVSGLPSIGNGALVTNPSGVPSISQLLPSAVQLQVGSFDSGINASSSTYWCGNGTWSNPNSPVVNGPFITYEADTNLPGAQNVGLLSTGVLFSTVSAGVSTVSSYGVTGTTDVVVLQHSPLIEGPQIVTGLYDANGNEMLGFTAGSGDVVNYTEITNTITGTSPSLSSIGADTNLNYIINAKGTGGFLGTGSSAGSSPSTGYIGQVISSIVVTPGSPISDSTPTNATSIDLTPGNWLVIGNVSFIGSGSNSCTAAVGAISTVSATFPDYSKIVLDQGSLQGTQCVTVPSQYVSITTTTTYYLVGQVNFSNGTYTQAGELIAIRQA